MEIAIRRRPCLRVVLDLLCVRDLHISITVPSAPILHRTPGPSTLESAELHSQKYSSNVMIIIQDKDAIMALKKSKSTAYILLSGASACLTQLCLLPFEIEQGSTIGEWRRSSVGYERENAYMVVGYCKYYCCTTPSFTPRDIYLVIIS